MGSQQANLFLDNYTADINATYNWWGTTDTQAINQTIHDFKNNFNLGIVSFVHFLITPNSQAPSLNTPISTPNPSISPTSTPTVPEFPSLAILPLLIAMLSIAVILMKKLSPRDLADLQGSLLLYSNNRKQGLK